MSLTFLSSVRQGLAGQLTTADTGTPARDATRLSDVSTITATASLLGVAANPVHLGLLGPADVIGLDPAAVIRTSPVPGAQFVDTTLMCLVEFDRPDLPWLFTPLAPDGERLRPWLALVCVPRGPGVSFDPMAGRTGRLPVLRVDDVGELPPVGETWAWAHAQIAGAVTTDAGLATALRDEPVTSLSRLLCPRKLAAERAYLACVVPTFEAGRLAGLGRDIPADVTLAPSWGTTGGAELPVYYSWEFYTREAGSFEQEVGRLRSVAPPGRTGRVLDAREPGPSAVADPGALLPLGGALRPRSLTIPDYAGPARAGYQDIARAGEVAATPAGRLPVVNPPLYGGRHVGATAAAAGTPKWLRDLNLDPRNRAIAALGAAIVRARQEDLMRLAWEQVGAIEEANRRLRLARLARVAGRSLVRRHLDPLDPALLLRAIGPGHSRLLPVGRDHTVAALVRTSRLPNAMFEAAFRGLTRPAGPVGRRLQSTPGAPQRLLDGLDTGRIVVDRHLAGRPGGALTLGGLLDVIDKVRISLRGGGVRVALDAGRIAAVGPAGRTPTVRADGAGLQATRLRISDADGVLGATTTMSGAFSVPGRDRLARVAAATVTPETIFGLPGKIQVDVDGTTVDATEAHREALMSLFATEEPMAGEREAAGVAALAGAALTALEPGVTVAKAVYSTLTIPAELTGADPLDEVLAAPVFPAPLAPDLVALAPAMVLPGLETVPADGVLAVVASASFAHAVLVGANYEMMRELRFRGFPTDERGTCFFRFWREDADEMQAIDRVRSGALGAAVSGGSDDVVVVVRSELFRRFPGTQVYAVPGGATGPVLNAPQLPVFRGWLAADTAYFGFPFTAAQATTAPGRHLVFQEPPAAPRFGLDAADLPAGQPWPATASGLAWHHLNLVGDHIRLGTPRPAFTDRSGIRWGESAAEQAIATLQQPVRAVVPFSRLLRQG